MGKNGKNIKSMAECRQNPRKMLKEANLKNKTLKRMISFSMLNEWKESCLNYKKAEDSRMHMEPLTGSTVLNEVR